MQQTLSGAPLPLRPREGLRAPMRLAAVVQRLLSRDPEHRYPSAARARRAWLEAAETHTPAHGALRPLIPGTLGLQSMETILVEPVRSTRDQPGALFSTVRATPSAGLDRRPRRDEPRGETPLGREAELEALLEALPPRTDRGAAAITGPDGVGKSALLRAAADALHDAGTRVVFTRGRRSGRCATMEALATLLLDAIGSAELGPARLAAERLIDAVSEAGGPAVAAGARDPLVGGLVGIGPTGATGSAAMEAFAAAEALLRPDERPVVLLIDDADGVDDGTWEVVRALRQRPGGGVGVLSAGRDRSPADDEAPVPLSPPPREALAEAWLRWTKGRHPLPEGVDCPADLEALAAAARLVGAADFEALLSFLEPAERGLLEVAAVFGGDVPKRGLPKVAEAVCAPHPVGEAALDAMLGAGFLVEVQAASARRERWLRLPSPALRRLLLDRLAQPERAHALSAQWLARDCLDDSATNRARTAELALAAGLPASAAYALGEAGRLELEAGRARDAAPYLERALALAAGDADEAIDRARNIAWLASAALAGHPEQADALAVEGLALAEPERAVLRAQLLYTRADAAVQRGRLEEALDHARAALEVLGEEGDPVELASAHALTGWILGYRLGRNEEGISHGRRALEVAARIVAPAFRASLCGRLGANYLRAGDWDGQLEANAEDLRLSTMAKDARGIVRANINLGVCFTNRGMLVMAREHTEAALALAERSGDASATQIAHNNLAMIALDDARPEDVDRHVRAVLEGAERTGHRRALPETLMTKARLCIARGDLDEADAALARAEAEGDVADLEMAQRIRARLELHRGEHEAALRRTTALLAQPEHDPYERAASRLAHASALAANGSAEAAAEEEEMAAQVFHRLGADQALEARRWRG